MRKSTKSKRIDWRGAPDVKRRVRKLIKLLGFSTVKSSRVFVYRSHYAQTRAYARIWGLANIWQKTLNQAPAYIIEVISEKFDRLSDQEQDEVLIHELIHIPHNFSGALLPHKRRGAGSFHDRLKRMLVSYRSQR